MQYESIILEMLSRIKKLEEDVDALKLIVESQGTENEQENMNEEEEGNSSGGSVSYQKMTDDMILYCYKCGKKMYEGENFAELAEDIVTETGMNRNSAIMYLYAVSSMLEGTVYKRAISAKALRKYFQWIFQEYGSDGLEKAIRATRLHTEYRKQCGHKVDSIEAMCDEFENIL